MAKTVSHSHAIYLEFHDTEGMGRVAQFIFCAFGASGNEIVPYRLISRTITPQNPQLRWMQDPETETPTEVGINPEGKLVRMTAPATALALANESFKRVVGSIDAMTNANWKLYQEPIVVQVSKLDLVDLKQIARPKKLIDRIYRVRASMGWDLLPGGAARGAA